MLKLLLLLPAVALLAYLLLTRGRQPVDELARDASDAAVAAFLRVTSQFGSELTEEGRGEQRQWRGRLQRDIRVRGRVDGA